MSLADLKAGQKAFVKGLTGDDFLNQQLQEMGFVSGSEVMLVSRSLFHGPLAVSVRGAILGLRFSEAECVQV
jgi:ferrous iron transport protein A